MKGQFTESGGLLNLVSGAPVMITGYDKLSTGETARPRSHHETVFHLWAIGLVIVFDEEFRVLMDSCKLW
jgi:hypothetical protein